MGFEIRCNCGWSSQVSEFYLGDRITCPDCSEKITVRQQSSVPYAYPPYTTWQKKNPAQAPIRLPHRRSVNFQTTNDPHATTAFGLGMVSLLMSLSVCGLVPGVIMAIGGIYTAMCSKRVCARNSLTQSFAPKAGFVMSVMALLISALIVFASSGMGATKCGHHRSRTVTNQTRPQVERHEYRYYTPNYDYYEEQRRLREEQLNVWNQDSEEGQQYRYSVSPKPEPVEPRDDFQRRQMRYSERVRESRNKAAQSAPKPGSQRYGD
ncbi:MAG: hypothetical protein KDB32_00080 [Planctomycetes bacterium]|nr:hypothetical protein [Planctomycetota bacterium]